MTSSPSLAATLVTQQRVAGWLSAEEFALVEAICDTFLPALEPPPESSPEQNAYYRRTASDLHVPLLIAETLGQEDATAQAELRQLLALFAGPLGGLLLIGKPQPFVKLSQSDRERYLLALANSPLPQFRKGYQVFKRLSGFLFFSVPTPDGTNPNWPVLDYPAPIPPTKDAFRPLKPLAIEQDTVLECDAVVIGSGAGGGVVAGELALAGKNVIVLEMGGYQSDSDFSLQETQAMGDLYLKRGTLATADLGTIILAGSTLGGGTVVNWTTSFRTPDDVLEEWQQRSSLNFLTASTLQESFSAVEQRISVNTENSSHNTQNQLLLDGASALGYHAGSLRRNAVGCEQRCGTCGFGCRFGSKQSTMKTYLQDAFDAGARIVVHCRVERVLIEQGRAVGVKAHFSDPQSGKSFEVTVRAKAVIAAAGALNSPAVLLRSGLENRHIGRHLHIHPTTTIAGFYSHKVAAWQGVMQSAYSDEFSHLTGNYGYKLEVPPSHPGLFGLATPWHSARAYREQMLSVANSATIIVLTRDRGEGQITLDPRGEPQIKYVTSVFDRSHLLHGLQQAARVHFAAGALGISSLHSKRTTLEKPADRVLNERDWRNFSTQLERHGMAPNRLIMFTAHQMGTCRLGADPRQSVVGEHQEVHGVKGLFVCDGSVFPAASGVNPMLSIMALSHRAAQYIKTTL